MRQRLLDPLRQREEGWALLPPWLRAAAKCCRGAHRCAGRGGQHARAGFSLLEPTPVLDPVANGRHRRPALPQTPPAPTVPFDPPKVQLDQWHRHHPDDEQEVF